ncbi:MAG: RdgB/HAM1 family non-canonical purine NTP pyrophosphatase [Anaerolineae bacterium]|nr:RdgB/HAM1 family non-canonical purine NTP pyrophosphatase [Anaerolineae bacterium]
MFDLLIGTSNPGKLREYGEMLAALPLRLISLREVGLASFDLEEPYETFAENAIHKAQTFARLSGLPALADDSGLAVDALGGRPGVYSARYAPGSDADRYTKLLGELEGVPEAARTARFVCVIAAVKPDGAVISAEGTVEGRIAFAPGEVINGFGYDAVFIPQGFEIVFSALPPAEKNRLSHRGIALQRLMPALDRWVNS